MITNLISKQIELSCCHNLDKKMSPKVLPFQGGTFEMWPDHVDAILVWIHPPR